MNASEPRASKAGRLLRTLAVAASELLLALVLVGGFFLAFLGIYRVSFPQGTRLTDAVGVRPAPAPSRTASAPAGGADEEPSQGPPFVALLTDLRRSVRDKPAAAIVWAPSSAGTPLGNRHAVQSFEDSGATIRFDEGNQLQLGENTMIVIRDMRRTPDRSRRVATVVVLGGELLGRLGPESGETPLMNIVSTASASLQVDPASSDVPAEFRIRAGPDDSATFSMLEGRARLTAAGRTIELLTDQSAEVDADGQIRIVEPLPPAPTPQLPGDGNIFTFRAAPPQVHFAWQAAGEREVYRFVLARDPEFAQIVHQALPTEPRFRHGNLRPGRYFWRVSTMRGSTEGPASLTRSFEVRPDIQPPALRVDFPDGTLERPSYTLAGATEPGADVFVDAQPVPTGADGSFRHSLTLRQGLNLVVVEALDPAGNTSYRSRLIQVRSPARENSP